MSKWRDSMLVRQNTIRPEAGRKEQSGKVLVREATAGITMSHQPAAVHEDWMEKTARPAQTRTFEKVARSVSQQLSHGIPYASGVSGSTNIADPTRTDWRHSSRPMPGSRRSETFAASQRV